MFTMFKFKIIIDTIISTDNSIKWEGLNNAVGIYILTMFSFTLSKK